MHVLCTCSKGITGKRMRGKNEMTQRTTIAMASALCAVLLAGCEANTKVEVRPPAAAPAPQVASINVRQPFPLPDQLVSTVSLRVDPRAAIDILVEQVQKDLLAGQQDFKAGNTDKGRGELDSAVNRILVSGFQADSDPRLSKLFDQIGETLHNEQLTSRGVQTGVAEDDRRRDRDSGAAL